MGTHPPILLGTVSMIDSLILMVMALVVFGPRRLPQIARQLGKLMYEFRKASNDFKFQMEEELRNAEEVDRRKKEEERQRSLAALAVEQVSVSADAPPAAATESPYPGEGQYPPATEESVPRIMPPSTGETVPAARPARAAETQSEEAPVIDPESRPELHEPAQSPEPNPSQNQVAAEALNQNG